MSFFLKLVGLNSQAEEDLTRFQNEYAELKSSSQTELQNLNSRVQGYISNGSSPFQTASPGIQAQFKNLASRITAQITPTKGATRSLEPSSKPAASRTDTKKPVAPLKTTRQSIPLNVDLENQDEESYTLSKTLSRTVNYTEQQTKIAFAPDTTEEKPPTRRTFIVERAPDPLPKRETDDRPLGTTTDYKRASEPASPTIRTNRRAQPFLSIEKDDSTSTLSSSSSFPDSADDNDSSLATHLKEVEGIRSSSYEREISYFEKEGTLLAHKVSLLERDIDSLLTHTSLTTHHIDCIFWEFQTINTSLHEICQYLNPSPLKDSLLNLQDFVKTKYIELLERSCTATIANDTNFLSLPTDYEHYCLAVIHERLSLHKDNLTYLQNFEREYAIKLPILAFLSDHITYLQKLLEKKRDLASPSDGGIGTLFYNLYSTFLYYNDFIKTFKGIFSDRNFYEQDLFIRKLLQFESKLEDIQKEMGVLISIGKNIPKELIDLSQKLNRKIERFRKNLATEYSERWLIAAQENLSDLSEFSKDNPHLQKEILKLAERSIIDPIKEIYKKYLPSE